MLIWQPKRGGFVDNLDKFPIVKRWLDPRPKERYRAEAERPSKVMDTALAGRESFAGDYSVQRGLAIPARG